MDETKSIGGKSFQSNTLDSQVSGLIDDIIGPSSDILSFENQGDSADLDRIDQLWAQSRNNNN